MRIRILKRYHGDEYRFKADINIGTHESSVHVNFKTYRARISDDFKRIELIDPIHIDGINGENPKDLTYLTIYKYDVGEVRRYITDTY